MMKKSKMIHSALNHHSHNKDMGLKMKKTFAMTALALGMTHIASAQIGITQVVPVKTLDQGTELRIAFDGLPMQPKAYQLDTPPRLVLDFNGAENKLTQPSLSVDSAEINSVLSEADATRTRLTVNLNRYGAFTTKTEGNNFILNVTPEGSTVTLAPSAESPRVTTGVTNIGFARGSRDEGLVNLNLLSSHTPVDVKQQGSKIVIRLLGSRIPTHLARRLNVTEFGTPISTVDAYNEGNSGVVVVQTAGSFDYMAYQTGDKMTISVKRQADTGSLDVLNKLRSQQPVYTGKKISLDFQDIEVRRVLQLLADFTNVNMVAADSVQGQITIRLKDVPWDQALDIILKSKNLDKRRNGNVIWIAPAAEILKSEEEQTKLLIQNLKLAPLQTEYIQLNYAKAADIEKLITVRTQSVTTNASNNGNNTGSASVLNGNDAEFSGSMLSPRGSVSVDARTNTIIINDTPQKIDQIRKLIALVDIPVKQVMIEARVIRAKNTFSKDLGVKWGVQSQGVNRNHNLLVGATIDNITSLSNATQTEAVKSLNVDLGAAAPTGQIALGLIRFSDFMLDLELSASQAEGLTEIVSTPKVLTADKQKAVIKSGTQIPYKTVSQSGTQTEFKDAVLLLEVTPSITPDGKVAMQLNISKDSVGQILPDGVSIDVNQISTNVQVNNGETIVLGGVFENAKGNNVTRVPFFSDLPVVGSLFKRTEKQDNKDELLIFITPRVVNDNSISR